MIAATLRTLANSVLLFLVASCSTPQPQLATIYKTARTYEDQPPVILIHGAFGGRLCKVAEGEVWPGGILDLVFNEYQDLALPVGTMDTERLVPCGMVDTAAGQDFYGKIEDTLTGAGGYQLTEPGNPVDSAQRHYYRFIYDWRKDNSQSAAALDAFVQQIRLDYGKPGLKVDLVAHSMGGLVARYWLRYGNVDVLDDNDFPLNNAGAAQVRKVILLGTPNLGSTSALQQLLGGADFGVNKISPEILLTFPSAYQLLPHPIVDSILGNSGQPLQRDIFDLDIWRALEWGPFDPQIRYRLQSQGWSPSQVHTLERYTGKHLERARRFAWSLTVKNKASPAELIVFGGDCSETPARIFIEDIGGESFVRLWPDDIEKPSPDISYKTLMLEPGDGAVTKASLLARTELDPSVPRHRFSDFPLDYAVMYCEDHNRLPGNITFQDNLLHILLSR